MSWQVKQIDDVISASSETKCQAPGFCGGWFIWCRWLPVVIVPGGGSRVPR